VEFESPLTRTILVVEDSECCATTLEIALLGIIPHINVRLVPSASQALEVLEAGNCLVSVLITDLHLPSMDGFELIERVRAGSRTANLPIVVISGDSDQSTCERISRLGANAYFGKPYCTGQVCHKVEALLAEHPLSVR
jgi:CheY-like chemotaxis protein